MKFSIIYAPLVEMAWATSGPVCAANNLIVQTKSGAYRGVINGTTPLVREFLGVPYAKPPEGNLRWMPPQKLENNGSHTYDATRYPPSCPQYVSKIPTVWNQVVTEYDIGGPISEDCLSLSIWTPAQGEGLPVIMFVTGGGFVTGGVEINYQLPYHWVERTQAHIVVTINYRLNIFGFPNAAGLEAENLGFLDQRMALEWVRDNIEAFGGDPAKITLWGQSAGAASVDVQNFAFYQDPIVTGFFAESGSVELVYGAGDPTYSNFTFVAANVGCSHPNNATAELECMRQVPWSTIEQFVGEYQDNGTSPAIAFIPVSDDVVVFSNYSDRYAKGFVSHRPAIFSTCLHEGRSLVAYNRSGVNETAATELTLTSFLCPASETAKLRTKAGLTTYRYQFAGNFPNDSPLPWMDSYHASDLPMLFATHQDYTNGHGHSTPFEFEVSRTMENLLYAFMTEPHTGPQQKGWAPVTSGELLRFGADGKVMQNVSAADVDSACAGVQIAL